MSFTDNMTVAPVGGIGSYQPDTLEPLQYSAGGTMTINRYSTEAWKAITSLAGGKTDFVPDRAVNDPAAIATRDGNSLMDANFFSPFLLMISRTFDIQLWERAFGGFDAAGNPILNDNKVLFHMVDCRMNSYSITFTPGALIQETVGFIARRIIDETAQPNATVQ
jgi:hypothetical protein